MRVRQADLDQQIQAINGTMARLGMTFRLRLDWSYAMPMVQTAAPPGVELETHPGEFGRDLSGRATKGEIWTWLNAYWTGLDHGARAPERLT